MDLYIGPMNTGNYMKKLYIFTALEKHLYLKCIGRHIQGQIVYTFNGNISENFKVMH